MFSCWKYDTDEKSYNAVMTKQPPPAQVSIVELCLCKCKSGCNTLRCNCKKNNLVCAEMCICDDCANDMSKENNNTDGSDDEQS